MCQSGAHSTWHLGIHRGLSYATQVWSPSQISLKTKAERVQGRATRWILQTRVGEMSYKDRLLALNLLPLTFERELKDIIFFYKCLNNLTDLNVKNFVSFACHGRTRLSSSYSLWHRYVKLAPISRPTLTELSNFGTTYVNCRHLQIYPLWTPSRTLLCFILCTYSRPLLMLTTSVPELRSEPAPAIASLCIFFLNNFCPFIYSLFNIGECPAWDLTSRSHPLLLGLCIKYLFINC